MIRGAVVVLCFGLVVTGWAIWRHTVGYVPAGLVVGFGLFGLYLGTYYGTPVDSSTSRQA